MKTLILKEAQAPHTLTLDEATLAEGPVQVLLGKRTIGMLVPPKEYAAFRAWQKACRHQQRVQQAHKAFDREVEAFEHMWPELLQKYRGQAVAIYDGQIVEVGHPGEGVAELAGRVYDRIGYVPIYVQQVKERHQVYKITGPRLVRQ